MRIEINSTGLELLLSKDSPKNCSLHKMTVKPLNSETEGSMYIFTAGQDQLIFKDHGDCFVAESNNKIILDVFCDWADKNDVSYTSIGFRPS
jgi:hypothetical protein